MSGVKGKGSEPKEKNGYQQKLNNNNTLRHCLRWLGRLGRQRQGELCDFQANQDCIMRPVSKNNKTRQQEQNPLEGIQIHNEWNIIIIVKAKCS